MSVLARSIGNAFRNKVRTAAVVAVLTGGAPALWGVLLGLALLLGFSVVGLVPMQLGDTGWRVRVLQSRLHQLDLHSEVVTSRFDRETREGVATFQRRRGWSAPASRSGRSPPSIATCAS